MPRVQDRKYSTKQPLCVYARTCARLISLFVLTHLVGSVLSGHRMILLLHLSEFGSFLSDRSNSPQLQYFPSPAEQASFHTLSAIRNRAESLRQSVLNMYFAAWTDGFQEKHSKKEPVQRPAPVLFTAGPPQSAACAVRYSENFSATLTGVSCILLSWSKYSFPPSAGHAADVSVYEKLLS